MTVHSATASSDIWQLLQTSLSNTSSTISSAVSLTTGTTSDQSTLSGPGKLFSELQTLSQSNPTEFKKITQQISDQLNAVASQTGDSHEANTLNKLATNFANAAQSGNFSDLFPANPGSNGAAVTTTDAPHTHGGHHGHHSSAVDSVVNQALSQIQTDLGTSGSWVVASTTSA